MKKRLGVLSYTLMPATVSFIERLANALEDWTLTAYPLFAPRESDLGFVDGSFRVHEKCGKARLAVFPDNSRVAKELMPTNLCLRKALSLARNSDMVLHLGVQALPALVTSFFCKVLGVPSIVLSRFVGPSVERRRHWLIRNLKRIAISGAAVHVAQTKGTVDTLRDVYGITADKLAFAPFEAGVGVFRGLIDEGRAKRQETREILGAKPGDVVFLHVGSLIQLKGIDSLLMAAARLNNDKGGWKLWIAGSPPPGTGSGYRNFLHEYASNLSCSGSVRFCGQLSPDQLARVYAAADVFVLNTRKDCFPKVLVEAALAGLPLITTDRCGAAGDIVVDGDNGFVVDANNPTVLSDRMMALLDRDLRKAFGKRSREMVAMYGNPDVDIKAVKEAIGRIRA